MTLKLDNQSIVDKKCIHGIEIELKPDKPIDEPGTYCASCLAEALQNGSLGISIGLSKKQKKAMKEDLKNRGFGDDE